jgi:hypothetical protein
MLLVPAINHAAGIVHTLKLGPSAPQKAPIVTPLLWTILYAFLLALALLPPFRRMLEEAEFDPFPVRMRA